MTTRQIQVTAPSTWDASSVQGLLEIWREDREINGRSCLNPATQVLTIHRFGEWLCHPRRGGLTRAIGTFVYRAGAAYVRNHLGFEIRKETRIGRRVHFAHQHGVVIAPETHIGDGTLIHHGVTIGLRMDGNGGPSKVGAHIGAGVRIGAGAVIIGAVNIGDGASIGPNAVVATDVPENGSVVAAPSRVLRMQGD